MNKTVRYATAALVMAAALGSCVFLPDTITKAMDRAKTDDVTEVEIGATVAGYQYEDKGLTTQEKVMLLGRMGTETVASISLLNSVDDAQDISLQGNIIASDQVASTIQQEITALKEKGIILLDCGNAGAVSEQKDLMMVMDITNPGKYVMVWSIVQDFKPMTQDEENTPFPISINAMMDAETGKIYQLYARWSIPNTDMNSYLQYEDQQSLSSWCEYLGLDLADADVVQEPSVASSPTDSMTYHSQWYLRFPGKQEITLIDTRSYYPRLPSKTNSFYLDFDFMLR